MLVASPDSLTISCGVKVELVVEDGVEEEVKEELRQSSRSISI